MKYDYILNTPPSPAPGEGPGLGAKKETPRRESLCVMKAGNEVKYL